MCAILPLLSLIPVLHLCALCDQLSWLCAWDFQSKICFVEFKYLQTTQVCLMPFSVTSEVDAGQLCAL